MNKTGQKMAQKAFMAHWKYIVFKYGVEKAKEFERIYVISGIEKALEYKKTIGG